MPDSTLSQAIREAYASAPVDVIPYDTLELRHSAFTAPIRVVAAHDNLTATLEADAPVDGGEAVLFVGYAFAFRRPEVSMSAVPEIEIVIDNVSGEIIDNIEASLETTEVIEMTYRPYVSTDLSAPQMDPPMTVTISHIEAINGTVTARATFGDLGNQLFPSEAYTAQRFPGLVR